MDSCHWCSQCKRMYDKSNEHDGHDVKVIGGEDPEETIIALDELIQFGLTSLQNREQEVSNAKQVKDDITDIREKFIETSRARVERICKDLRVAMEAGAGQLLNEVNKKVGDMELRCQSVITTSRVKLDTIKSFIQQAAVALPDEDGKLDPKQLTTLFGYYRTVRNHEDQPRPRIKHVEVNVKYPNSYQRKSECQALARSICGEIENPKRSSFIHTEGLPESNEEEEGDEFDVEDAVMPLPKPQRRMSRDLLKN